MNEGEPADGRQTGKDEGTELEVVEKGFIGGRHWVMLGGGMDGWVRRGSGLHVCLMEGIHGGDGVRSRERKRKEVILGVGNGKENGRKS